MDERALAALDLRDIHAAPAVGWWPLAPGWWVLIILTTAALTLLLFLLADCVRRRWRRHRRQQSIVRELDSLQLAYRSDGDARAYAAAVSMLLKRAALARFPTEQVASLNTVGWLRFLDRTTDSPGFSEHPGAALATAPYRPNHPQPVEIDQLHRLAASWLKHNVPV